MTLIRLHLKPFFGSMLLMEISREALRRYVDTRTAARVICCGKASKKLVHRGTVSNELSLLRRMLRIAAREDYKVTLPSFLDLIVRTSRGGRDLSQDEQTKVNAVYSPWMRRLSGFAVETYLSEGDLLRLTESMIDEKAGVIIPDGGRKKTGARHIAPLTKRAREILEEIRAERRSGAAVPNVSGFVFTNRDGKPITKGQIEYQVERAIRLTGVRKFVFHNYRNTALTHWSRQGINVDIAMLASGHSSVQMHKRYVDLQQQDVAKAFGTIGSKVATQRDTRKRKRSASS
jgi:integrase